jgi:hypothetical protein
MVKKSMPKRLGEEAGCCQFGTATGFVTPVFGFVPGLIRIVTFFDRRRYRCVIEDSKKRFGDRRGELEPDSHSTNGGPRRPAVRREQNDALENNKNNMCH